mmetsp:Transcript_26016/g.87192  ORF Transcript_26016/g.87192 Transcript_26016/m.87192 type:complete len:427 (+) Transcript_26016:241-1521(+)
MPSNDTPQRGLCLGRRPLESRQGAGLRAATGQRSAMGLVVGPPRRAQALLAAEARRHAALAGDELLLRGEGPAAEADTPRHRRVRGELSDGVEPLPLVRVAAARLASPGLGLEEGLRGGMGPAGHGPGVQEAPQGVPPFRERAVGGLAVPARALLQVHGHPPSLLVAGAQAELRPPGHAAVRGRLVGRVLGAVALLGGLAVPAHRRLQVLGHAVAARAALAHHKLRGDGAVVRGGQPPARRVLGALLREAQAVLVAERELALRLGACVVRRLAEPAQRALRVRGRALAAEEALAQGVLPMGVALLRGLVVPVRCLRQVYRHALAALTTAAEFVRAARAGLVVPGPAVPLDRLREGFVDEAGHVQIVVLAHGELGPRLAILRLREQRGVQPLRRPRPLHQDALALVLALVVTPPPVLVRRRLRALPV